MNEPEISADSFIRLHNYYIRLGFIKGTEIKWPKEPKSQAQASRLGAHSIPAGSKPATPSPSPTVRR